MCTNDIYTDVYPDGCRNEYQSPTFCPASRNGRICANPTIYNHPPRSVPYAPGYAVPMASSAAYPYTQPAPLTPPHSPHRGLAVDQPRPRKDSSSSDRNRRPSGVYVNGQKILDLNRKTRSRAERIIIVDSPPTPRTPPQQFAMPYTAPASPNTGFDAPQFAGYSHARRNSLHPVIVDERPRSKVEIEVIDAGHRRYHSSDSRYSHSSGADEERRRRRHEKERKERKDREERERAEGELRRQGRIRARIEAQNEKISRRPAVPVPTAPFRRSSTGHANVPLSGDRHEQELVDAVRRMEINERLAAERRALDEEEEEARRQRLVERMMPRRRATVGPGNRRHRVLYDDGLYRWE